MGAMGQGIAARPRYETSIDRLGRALAIGSGLGGLLILMLLVSAGQRGPLGLLAGLAIGTLFVAIALAAVGGPIWLVLHALGFRRGLHAGLVTGLLGLGLYAGAQGYGTALYTIAPIDTRSWLLGLAFKVAQGAIVALLAGGIGVAMWRVAYRPTL